MPSTVGTNGGAAAVEDGNLDLTGDISIGVSIGPDAGAGTIAIAAAAAAGATDSIGGGRRTASRARCSFMMAMSISRCCCAWASALEKRTPRESLAWARATVEVEVAGEEVGAETIMLEEVSGEREPRELSAETLRLWAVAGCVMAAGVLLLGRACFFPSCRRISQVTSRPVSGFGVGASQFVLRTSRISCSERAICAKRSLCGWLGVEGLAALGVPMGASCFLYCFSSLVVRTWRAISSLLVCQMDRSRNGTRLVRDGLVGWMAEWRLSMLQMSFAVVE